MSLLAKSYGTNNSLTQFTNSALITIPMCRVPRVLIPYGAMVFLKDASMVMDQIGFMIWDQQS
jgi:hypothetical protein